MTIRGWRGCGRSTRHSVATAFLTRYLYQVPAARSVLTWDSAPPAPAFSSLLPHGDAVHHLRRRGRLLLSLGGAAAPAQVVRSHRDAGLHRDPSHRAGPHLEEGRAGLGVEALAESLGRNILTTTLGKVVGWGRGNSVWPAQFGLACCAIEMIATATAGVDIGRFGSEAFRASPHQSDLMIVPVCFSQTI